MKTLSTVIAIVALISCRYIASAQATAPIPKTTITVYDRELNFVAIVNQKTSRITVTEVIRPTKNKIKVKGLMATRSTYLEYTRTSRAENQSARAEGHTKSQS